MRLERVFWTFLISLILLGITPVTTKAQDQALKVETEEKEMAVDEVTVSFPYPVRAGGETLSPGDYAIRMVPNRIQISKTSDASGKLELRLGVNQFPFGEPAKETKVLLHRMGSDYMLNEVWIQGKGYYYKVSNMMTEPFRAAVPEDGMSDKDAVGLTAKYQQVTVTETVTKRPKSE
jgi:hypothetical protein